MEDAVRFFKNTREYLTPVLTESAFLDKGMLTPEGKRKFHSLHLSGSHFFYRVCPSG